MLNAIIITTKLRAVNTSYIRFFVLFLLSAVNNKTLYCSIQSRVKRFQLQNAKKSSECRGSCGGRNPNISRYIARRDTAGLSGKPRRCRADAYLNNSFIYFCERLILPEDPSNENRERRAAPRRCGLRRETNVSRADCSDTRTRIVNLIAI